MLADLERFEKWLAVLSDRVPYDEEIVLPMGEGLNVVRSASTGELVVRCDCGHDFCAPDRNWKMEALIFVRDDPDSMGEIYPGFAGPDTDWSELRKRTSRNPTIW